MKGVILAGGLGTRLHPLTLCTNKHLLPIYDKPMIYYPIDTLVKAGIKDILIIVSGQHAGQFLQLLRNGENFNCRIQFAFQEKMDGGIADALAIAESFVGNDNVCVILGDNTTDANINSEIKEFELMKAEEGDKEPCALLFLKDIKNPKDFGVAEFDANGKIKKIVEKPSKPPSNKAVVGLYIYDKFVFDFAKKCKPSSRGQLEITDVNNYYIENGTIEYCNLKAFWLDAGTFENLFNASEYWKKISENNKTT